MFKKSIGPPRRVDAQLPVEAVRVLEPEPGFEGEVDHSSLTDTQLPLPKDVMEREPEPELEGLVEGCRSVMAQVQVMRDCNSVVWLWLGGIGMGVLIFVV